MNDAEGAATNAAGRTGEVNTRVFRAMETLKKTLAGSGDGENARRVAPLGAGEPGLI